MKVTMLDSVLSDQKNRSWVILRKSTQLDGYECLSDHWSASCTQSIFADQLKPASLRTNAIGEGFRVVRGRLEIPTQLRPRVTSIAFFQENGVQLSRIQDQALGKGFVEIPKLARAIVVYSGPMMLWKGVQ
jgi:hypothetical protein